MAGPHECRARRVKRPGIQGVRNTLMQPSFVPERLVGFGRLPQRQPMGDDEGGGDLALFDARQQRSEVVLRMGLSHLQGKALSEGGAHGQLVDETEVDARDRQVAALAAAHDDLAQHMQAVGGEVDGALHLVEHGVEAARTVCFRTDRFKCTGRVFAGRSHRSG